MSDILSFSDVTVRFGRRKALDSLNLKVEDRGRVVGLFGQNGAGKSTMMRVTCGIINRHSGQVVHPDRVVGYLPDTSFLYEFLTIDQCISMAEALFSDFDADIARQIFSALGLAGSLRVSAASKGMAEQVHLGLILARRCRLYVFDEPLAAVDPVTRDRLIELIRQYRHPDSTAIISTHLIGGLEELFDEAIVIQDGRRVLQDDVRTIAQSGGLEARVKEVISQHVVAH